MSIKHILLSMEASVGSSARKLVLIKLADNANDEGVCFPSYKNIADHCEMSKRSVMSHIKRLESDGFLSKSARKTSVGNSSNVYKLSIRGGENSSPPSENSSPPPSENFSPRTCHSFEPVKEPKEKSTKKEFSVDDDLSLKKLAAFKPENVLHDLWLAFIKTRKKRKATQTARAINGQLRELALCEKSGMSATLAIERYLEESWRALKCEYLCKPGGSNAVSNGFGKETASERNARISQETTQIHEEAVAEAVANGFV